MADFLCSSCVGYGCPTCNGTGFASGSTVTTAAERKASLQKKAPIQPSLLARNVLVAAWLAVPFLLSTASPIVSDALGISTEFYLWANQSLLGAFVVYHGPLLALLLASLLYSPLRVALTFFPPVWLAASLMMAYGYRPEPPGLAMFLFWLVVLGLPFLMAWTIYDIATRRMPPL